MKIVVVEDEVRIREGIIKLISKVFQNLIAAMAGLWQMD